jgi:hypothetical protein
MTRRFYNRSEVTGKITLPAVPGMIDEYVKMCADLFAGIRLRESELARRRLAAHELVLGLGQRPRRIPRRA